MGASGIKIGGASAFSGTVIGETVRGKEPIGREEGATARRLDEAITVLAETVQSVDHLACRVSERLLGYGVPARGKPEGDTPELMGILPVTTHRAQLLTERLQDARDVLANLATELGDG